MFIRPELRALRGDDAAQREAQTILHHEIEAWRNRPDVAQVLKEIAAFGGGDPLDRNPALAALFDEEGEAANALALDFARTAAMALVRAPLGHLPLKHFTNGWYSTLLLAASGNVTLSLVAVEGEGLAANPAPSTADFPPGEVWERVLSGAACADLVESPRAGGVPVPLDRREIVLRGGMILRRRSERQSLLLRAVEGSFVTLRLQRRVKGSAPTREYRLSDGVLVHQAASNPRDSRIELMIALLGRMNRQDAAPLLAEIAVEEGSEALRWQALRECLALDTRAGFTALTHIARSAGDPLATAAGALRSHLVETYPQLVELEPCPA